MAEAKYEVLEKSFLNKGLREEGDIVVLDIKYDPKVHRNVRPVDGVKPARKPRTTGKPGLVAEGDEDIVDTNDDGEDKDLA